MKNKFLTHYYLKESKKDKEGMIPIYMRITVNGERAEISTNKRVLHTPDNLTTLRRSKLTTSELVF